MLTLAAASLRHQARRYVAPVLAVVIGVAFVAASMTLTASLKASTRAALADDLPHYAAVVLAGEEGAVPASALQTVRRLPEVADVVVHRTGSLMLALPSGPRLLRLTTPPSPTSAARLVAGRMPTRPGDITLSRSAAAGAGIGVGDTVRLDQLSESARRSSATVVGVVDSSADPRYGGMPVAFALDADVVAWTGTQGYEELDVVGTPAAPVDQVRDAVAAALDTRVVVRTGEQEAERVLNAATGRVDTLGLLLLAFATVALFVSALVIGNTFAILVARRRRDTALLRCVGATARQVRRLALVESLVVGVVGAASGVALGLGLAAGLAQLANRSASLDLPRLHLALDPVALVVPAVVGVVVTVLAASLPVWRAGRVAPLEALRPPLPAVGRTRASVARLVVALLLLVGGAALLVGGPAHFASSAATLGVMLGMAGGVASFSGILLLASRYVPVVARVLGGLPARLVGPPGELAVDNAVCNPARAAATSAALLVGVTLIAMMLVGGQTTSASVAHEIDSHYPVDLTVSGSGQTLPADAVRRVESLADIAVAARLPQVTVEVGHGDAAAGAPEEAPVVGVPAAARPVLREPALLGPLVPGTLLVDQDAADEAGLTTGERVTVKAGERHTTFVVRVGARLPYPYLATEADVRRLAPQAGVAHLWLRLADDTDVPRAMEAVSAAASDVPGLLVSGSAPDRAQISQALDVVLLIVTVLLGVSVLIAVVGVGNTLSLSVLERTRESALLRAIGLTRGQLRLTIAVEALILAGVGAVVGCLLGIAYGWAGARALLPDRTIVMSVPWGRLGVVVAVALVAGLLASVLPARRAARVAPAAALTAE